MEEYENTTTIVESNILFETENAIANVDYITITVLVIILSIVLITIHKKFSKKGNEVQYPKKPKNIIDGQRTLKLWNDKSKKQSYVYSTAFFLKTKGDDFKWKINNKE